MIEREDTKQVSGRANKSGGGEVASHRTSPVTELFSIVREGEASKRSREEERMRKKVERKQTSLLMEISTARERESMACLLMKIF